MSELPATHKFTVQDYFRLYETGFLNDEDRIELLNGDLILMHAIGHRHAQALMELTTELGERARRRYKISPQSPVELDQFSAPQPDLVLVPRVRKIPTHPKPEDVVLIVEISDTSLRYDRDSKLRAYARTGIRELWIVNLVDDVIEIYRQPEGDGYLESKVVGLDGTVAPEAFPDVELKVAEIIPPR